VTETPDIKPTGGADTCNLLTVKFSNRVKVQIASVGTETDIKPRAFYSSAGLRSLTFDVITVRKV